MPWKRLIVQGGASRAVAALARLGRDRRGVALVETIFAVTLMVLFIIIMTQLYYISDLAGYTMAAVHRKATREIHDMDYRMKFELRHEVEVSKSLPVMPGMQKWLEHFNLGDVPHSFSVTRRAVVAGGSYMGVGYSLYALVDPFGPHFGMAGGSRIYDVISSYATQLDIGQWSAPVWDMLLKYITDELIWEGIMHVLDYYLPPGTPDWVKEMIAKEIKKMIDDWTGG